MRPLRGHRFVRAVYSRLTVSIAKLLKSGRAAHAFVQGGLPAAEELLDAIRKKKHEALGYLENVLVAIRASGLAELYAPLLAKEDLDDADDVLLGLRLLGATHDPRALTLLVRYLEDSERMWRDRAAAAIAELAFPTGAPHLVAYARELLPDGDVAALADRCARDYEMRPLRALIAVAIGLARVGDHSLAFVPISLVTHTYPKRTDRFEQLAVRIEAAEALQHVVGPGLYDAIAACIRGREVEAARHGAFAAFLLGTRKMVPLLIEAAKKRDHELKANAPIWLHRLFARDDAYEEMPLARRIKQLGEIPDGVVYRMGKPREERDVIELLRTELAHDALRELSITLGDLSALSVIDARDQPELYRRAVERLAAHPAEPGSLRRHGFAIPLPW